MRQFSLYCTGFLRECEAVLALIVLVSPKAHTTQRSVSYVSLPVVATKIQRLRLYPTTSDSKSSDVTQIVDRTYSENTRSHRLCQATRNVMLMPILQKLYVEQFDPAYKLRNYRSIGKIFDTSCVCGDQRHYCDVKPVT